MCAEGGSESEWVTETESEWVTETEWATETEILETEYSVTENVSCEAPESDTVTFYEECCY